MALEVGVRVQTRVEQKTVLGTVRHNGKTEFADGLWIGVELDEPLGKNNGTVHGRTYFSCADAHGIFCRPSSFQLAPAPEPAPGRSSADARSSATTVGPADASGSLPRANDPEIPASAPAKSSTGKGSRQRAEPAQSATVVPSCDSNASNPQQASQEGIVNKLPQEQWSQELSETLQKLIRDAAQKLGGEVELPECMQNASGQNRPPQVDTIEKLADCLAYCLAKLKPTAAEWRVHLSVVSKAVAWLSMAATSDFEDEPHVSQAGWGLASRSCCLGPQKAMSFGESD